MDFNSLFTAIIAGGVISTIITVIANARSNSASTYKELAHTVDVLRSNLDAEVLARKRDRDSFEEQLSELEKDYEEKIKNLQNMYHTKLAALEKRVVDLEKERNQLLVTNHRLEKQNEKLEAQLKNKES